MPEINSFPDVTEDWVGVLDAAEKNPDLQPLIETERQSLTQLLAEVQSLKGRQVELTALRQEVTQQLRAALARGKELVIRIRSVVRGKVGPRNERLVHWRVAPLRRRPRRPGVKPDGEAPASAAASPSTKPVV